MKKKACAFLACAAIRNSIFWSPKTANIRLWCWARVPAGASWPGFCGGSPPRPNAILPETPGAKYQLSASACNSDFKRLPQHEIDLLMPTRCVGVTMRPCSGGPIHDSQSDADSRAHIFRRHVAQRAKQTFGQVERTHRA